MSEHKLEMIDSLVSDLDTLEVYDKGALDALRKRAMMVLTKYFGKDNDYAVEINGMWFYPTYPDASADEKLEAWNESATEFRNVLRTAREDIQLSEGISASQARSAGAAIVSTDVFVVHGHDEELKQSVARTLEKLGLNPVILHEKANKGRTIIEKFSDYSNVEFAVVLLSPDDIARARNSDSESYRARQNVVLELGFFLGKLGRERVASIFRPHEDFEMPSDYDGVIFIEYNDSGTWRFKLAKELKEAGYEIDFNAIA